ncbi:MAG: chemotaxis protein CheD [Bacteroidales bacterium]
METNYYLTMDLPFENNPDIQKDLKIHFLLPGTIFVSKVPCIINTILGSCVAVCIWDKVSKIGGMNHIMLPLWNGNGLASPKYGNIATDVLYEKLLNYGANPSYMSAKIFGGAGILEHNNTSVFNIGERNTEIALEVLKKYKIPVISQNTGGTKGRKIMFFSETGIVRMKYIEKTNFE